LTPAGGLAPGSSALFWEATAIFVLGYVLIISEKVHKTIVAVAGAALVLLCGILE